MRTYDPTSPLVAIHIPKAAGSSVKACFKRWFGDGLLEHYGSEPSQRHEVAALHSVARPVAVYGHFNRQRGFGVEDDHPEATQFVTILRNPFEAAISSYYFSRKSRRPGRRTDGSLREYLAEVPPNMLDHFPREVTRLNYRDQIEEFFFAIGVTEQLEESVRRIAAALGKPFEPDWLPFVNATARDQEHPADMYDAYVERHALEFEVYDYVVARFNRESETISRSVHVSR